MFFQFGAVGAHRLARVLHTTHRMSSPQHANKLVRKSPTRRWVWNGPEGNHQGEGPRSPRATSSQFACLAKTLKLTFSTNFLPRSSMTPRTRLVALLHFCLFCFFVGCDENPNKTCTPLFRKMHHHQEINTRVSKQKLTRNTRRYPHKARNKPHMQTVIHAVSPCWCWTCYCSNKQCPKEEELLPCPVEEEPLLGISSRFGATTENERFFAFARPTGGARNPPHLREHHNQPPRPQSYRTSSISSYLSNSLFWLI